MTQRTRAVHFAKGPSPIQGDGPIHTRHFVFTWRRAPKTTVTQLETDTLHYSHAVWPVVGR